MENFQMIVRTVGTSMVIIYDTGQTYEIEEIDIYNPFPEDKNYGNRRNPS